MHDDTRAREFGKAHLGGPHQCLVANLTHIVIPVVCVVVRGERLFDVKKPAEREAQLSADDVRVQREVIWRVAAADTAPEAIVEDLNASKVYGVTGSGGRRGSVEWHKADIPLRWRAPWLGGAPCSQHRAPIGGL